MRIDTNGPPNAEARRREGAKFAWIRLGALLRMAANCSLAAAQNVAIKGKTVHTMAGPAIENGVVVIREGKIAAVGPAGQVAIPDGFEVLEAPIVTPGLVDAHSVVGLTGIYNQDHDQDQLESSDPIQPELRAIDAYKPQEVLIGWLRGFGITTVHTGHAPGELISGQTMIVKTVGNTVAEAVVVPTAAVAATLGPSAHKSDGKAPGSRGKAMGMLRAELIKAREYVRKRDAAEEDKKPDRDLKLDALARALSRELPLMVTVQRVQDIAPPCGWPRSSSCGSGSTERRRFI